MTEADTTAARLSQDDIEVHWQHPRHALENPVLLVWPNPLRENWAAEIIDEGTAKVVCREVLYREAPDNPDERGEIKKRAEFVRPHDDIPEYVETALLGYESEYGPIDSVVNPVRASGVNDEGAAPPNDPQVTLEEYFNYKPSDGEREGSSAGGFTATTDEEDELVENLLCGGRQSVGLRRK